ncbi:hypothetical protein JCM30760_22380 [Thiomicrorhabdus hydrogeniphila]
MSLEEFNKHQQDVRTRTDSLVKAIFILAGGALSISIGIFLNIETTMQPEIIQLLKISWFALGLCILSLVLMLTTVLSRDYFFGERWRIQLNNPTNQNIDASNSWDIFIWLLAITGLFSFIGGFGSLVYAAIELLACKQ